MNFRSKEIYVSPKTKKRLFYIRESLQPEAFGIGTKPPPTIDDIAERLINEKIEQDYPNIKVLEKRLDALEGQLISELLTPTVEK